ncbi:MAG: cyclodeaminase/cyclohydrolase family protein [Candidatus Omnitrophica bacterium]|nr:cyclodeaminase/cyclohydrolase family protein [Candidatus Omnitrophota bacterium]
MYARKSINFYLDSVASRRPTPGGGSVAALCAALGAALDSMVVNYTLGNKTYASVEKEMCGIRKKNENIRKRLIGLLDKDTRVYQKLNSVLALSRQNKKRTALVQKYLKEAANVPFEICILSFSALILCGRIVKIGNLNLITDAGCAAYLLESAYQCAVLNVKINLKYIKDKNFVRKKREYLTALLRKVVRLKQATIKQLERSL